MENSVPIMAAKFTDLGNNCDNLYNETLQHDMKDITWKDYWQCNIKVAKLWGEHCPEYYPVRTQDVLAEDLQDQRKLFYCRYKKDLVYKGLNVKYFIKFFMAMKKKENGNFLSFMDLWKYKDAIMWAASMAEERLPTTFYEEIEKFLKGYKKELVKHGETATPNIVCSIPSVACMVSWEQQYFCMVLDAASVELHGTLCFSQPPWFSQFFVRSW
jgi:hypothetical protein